MSNSIAPGSSADVNVRVTALTTNPNVPAQYKTVILKKNLVNGVNTLTQEMMSAINTKYVIKYNYVLGEDVTIPADCVLEFDGGSLSGSYTITGANTGIQAGLVKIFNTDVTFAGTWNVAEAYPEWFGAKGDGETDDVIAIQKCLNSFAITKFASYKNYLVSTTVTFPRNKSIDGNRAKIIASSNFVDNSIGASVPEKTIVYVQAREAVIHAQLLMISSFIKNLKVEGKTGNVGIYFGTENQSLVTESTSVNNCVYGYNISNIDVEGCDIGIQLGEVWDTVFNDLHLSGSTYPMLIQGQIVNNVFNSCRCYGGTSAIRILGGYYGSGNQYRRPEGCSFNGGFYGEAEIGVSITHALAFYFSKCIIDLNTQKGLDLIDADDVTFDSCYIYANNNDTSITTRGVDMEPVSTLENNTYLKILGCTISAKQGIHIGARQNNIHIMNNNITQSIKSIFDNPGLLYVCFNVFNNNNMYEFGSDYQKYKLIYGNSVKGKDYPIDPSIPTNISFKKTVTSHTDYLKLFTANYPDSTVGVNVVVGNITINNISQYKIEIRNNKCFIKYEGIKSGSFNDIFYAIENGVVVCYMKLYSVGIANVSITPEYVKYNDVIYNMEFVENPSNLIDAEIEIGSWYFNNNITPARPVYWNGTDWVDATGATV